MQKEFVFPAHTVCSWKPSWSETIDDVLWAGGYPSSSDFLWRVGHINSWFCTAMQLVGTVIILHAHKCEKVHTVLAAAFPFPRWGWSAGAQWPLRLIDGLSNTHKRNWFSITATPGTGKMIFITEFHEFQEMKPVLHQGKTLPEHPDAALGSCTTPDILCAFPCLKRPTDCISNRALTELSNFNRVAISITQPQKGIANAWHNPSTLKNNHTSSFG